MEIKKYGSKYHLLRAIDDGSIKRTLSNIDFDIQSVIPSKGSEKEYSIEKYFKEHAIKSKDSFSLQKWWVLHGGKRPTWDMLALSKDGREVTLVEAKAHKGECQKGYKNLSNTANKDQKENHRYIEKCISEELKSLGGKYNGYYQIANRIAYANFIAKHYGLKVNLVFLGFINDTHFKDHYRSKEEFINKISSVIKEELSVDLSKNENIQLFVIGE